MCFNPKPALISYGYSISKSNPEPHIAAKLKFIDYLDTPKYRNNDNFIWIPCGKCLACRISKSNDWATRCYLEGLKWHNNCFVTLSYDNKHIHNEHHLVMKDLQNFFKRLRKQQKGIEFDKNGRQPIRYFACGEYGDKTLRPHYHVGLYNYIPNDLKFFKFNKCRQPLYLSKTIEEIWGNGFIIIGALTLESAGYIARYTQKKIYEKHKYLIENVLNRPKEFITTSRRGGIGLDCIQDIELFKKIKRNFGVMLTQNGQVKIKNIPRAIRKKWAEIDDIEYIEAYENNRKLLREQNQKKLNEISQHEIERMETETKMRTEQLKKLRREAF